MIQRSQLLAGAAKVDVTPEDLTGLTNLWRTPFEGVHDRIYLRALVVSDGSNSAAIVASDLLEYGNTTVVRERVEQATGIPADRGVHSQHDHHGSRRVGDVRDAGERASQQGGSAKREAIRSAGATEVLTPAYGHDVGAFTSAPGEGRKCLSPSVSLAVGSKRC